MRQILKSLLAAISIFACNALAAAAGPELTADTLSYDIKTHVRTASGNAVFVNEGVTLEAEIIYFDEGTRVAHAVGNVRVTRPDFRLVTGDLTYNMDEKSFRCVAFRAGFPPMFLEGKSAYGTPDKVELTDVVAYVGEPEPSTPTLAAEHMVLSTGKRILSVGTKPGVGKMRLFRVPEISGQLTELPSVDASVDVGYEGNLGVYTSAKVEIPVSTHVATGANVDFYSERGVLVGPTASYKYEGGDTEMAGSLSSGWIHDYGDLGYDYNANAVPENRWFIQQRHKQVIDDKVYVTSYVNLMSDPAMMRDFRGDYFENDQYPDNYVEMTMPIGQDVVLSALTRFSAAGNDYATIQRLPELRLDYLTNPLPFGGLYQTGFVMFAATDYTVDDVHYRNQRLHSFYGLSRPFALASWLNLMPKVGGFAGYYDKAWLLDGASMTAKDGATHYIGELGVDLVATFNSQWDFKSERWGIDGLRHVVRPVVNWRHYGTSGDDEWTSIDVDDGVAPIVMPSIDLRDLEANDYNYLFNPHFARTGIENILQTRDGATSRELASLNLYHDSNFNDHSRDLTYVQMALNPTKFIRLSFENGFDTEPLASEWYRARLTLKSADRWSMNFYADYYADNYEDYSGSYFYQLTRDWGAMAGASYDAKEGEFDRLSLSIFQHIGSFWKIRYRVSYNKDDLRQDDIGLSISVAGATF